MLMFLNRAISKLKLMYRERVFYEKTGYRAKLHGDIILINRNLKLGKNVSFYPYVQIFGDGLIEIGDNVDIGTGTILYASRNGGIRIGANTLIAAQSYIIDMDHGTSGGELIRNQQNTVSPISIGCDCWIAANVTILKGSVIEDGAIIGAKSLVKGKIEKNSINVGIPAKCIKYRE